MIDKLPRNFQYFVQRIGFFLPKNLWEFQGSNEICPWMVQSLLGICGFFVGG